MDFRRSLPAQMSLVEILLPVLLEPIDELLEWDVVFVMEEEAFRAHLDEFFHHLFFRHIDKHDVLRIVWKDGKPIWYSARFFLLLIFWFWIGFFLGISGLCIL